MDLFLDTNIKIVEGHVFKKKFKTDFVFFFVNIEVDF